MNDFRDFLLLHKWRIIFCLLGILFAVLVLTINFWRTLLIFVIVGLAYFIGLLFDQGGRSRVAEFINSLFAGGRKE